MQRFLFASAENTDAITLVTDCLNRIGDIPAEANLGFVYGTDRIADDLREILVHLQRHAPGVHWIGTVGVAVCVRGREIYDRPALALMIGAFPTDSFRVLANPGPDLDELPDDVRRWWQAQASCFALLHGDPANPATPVMLERLAQRQGNSFFNGGLTSSNGANPQLAGVLVSGGLSGVVFNDRVSVLTDHTQGCTPLGPVHEITQAQQNIAITLDHRPALEVMKSDIGEVLARDLAKIGGYIFAALPIQTSDTGDYLVRNLMGFDPERNLVAVGDRLDNESKIMFCRRDGNTAREDMERMLERLRKRIGDRPVRGAVYISCLGRGRYQFGENSEELKLIQKILGDAPLVGFFANGEVYNGRLYGYTGVLSLFL